MQSSDPRHFFETDAEQEKRARRAAKSGNKYGSPVVLKSKILAVLADPTSSSHVFVAESAGSARRVNLDDGDTKEVFRGPAAPVTCLALLAGDGQTSRTLFAGCWDKAVWSFDVATRQPGRKYVGHSDFVKAVVCGRLGGQAILISGGADKKILVWDVATGRRLHTLQDSGVMAGGPAMMAVQDLAIDPVATTANELWLVSASSDPQIRRWRVRLDGWEQVPPEEGEAEAAAAAVAEAARPRKTLLVHETTVYKLVFEDYNYVNVGGGDGDGDGDDEEAVDLWTSSADGTVKCLSRLHGFSLNTSAKTDGDCDTYEHGDHVRAVAVTDTWVITAGRDENLQFWDRASGQRQAVIEGHYDEVTGLAVLPDRRRVCSVSLDGTVRTWPLGAGEVRAVAKQQAEDKRKREAGEVGEEEEDGDDDNGKKEKNAAAAGPGSLMTAEEEAELAELMDDDD